MVGALAESGGGMGEVVRPTDVEVFFYKDDIIVSKTDLKGRITDADQTFCQIAGYSEAELLGQPHSIIRHPDMPRAVFKLLWDTLPTKAAKSSPTSRTWRGTETTIGFSRM